MPELTLNADELNRIREWFGVVEDLHPHADEYLEHGDRALITKICQAINWPGKPFHIHPSA